MRYGNNYRFICLKVNYLLKKGETNMRLATRIALQCQNSLHGNLPTIEKAATEYLQHVLPDYKPNRLKNIPTMEDIARLSKAPFIRNCWREQTYIKT